MNEVAEKIIQTTKAAWVNNADIKPVFICGACDPGRGWCKAEAQAWCAV